VGGKPQNHTEWPTVRAALLHTSNRYGVRKWLLIGWRVEGQGYLFSVDDTSLEESRGPIRKLGAVFV